MSTLLELSGPPTAVAHQVSNFTSVVPRLLLQRRITLFLDLGVRFKRLLDSIDIILLTKGTDNVTTILERFADAGFTVPEVIALLASHSIAAAVRSQHFACFHYQH